LREACEEVARENAEDDFSLRRNRYSPLMFSIGSVVLDEAGEEVAWRFEAAVEETLRSLMQQPGLDGCDNLVNLNCADCVRTELNRPSKAPFVLSFANEKSKRGG